VGILEFKLEFGIFSNKMISCFQKHIIIMIQLGFMMALSAQAQISTDGTLGARTQFTGAALTNKL
jgi:hypothetical protein